jgi:murein DD-endopeptidase MepM/ murein hydrolase activator NlpD
MNRIWILVRVMVLVGMVLGGTMLGSALIGCSGQFIPDLAGETAAQATPILAYPISSIEAAHLTDGKIYYTYELALINPTQYPVTLENIDVVNRLSPEEKYASFPGSAIPAMLKKAGGASDNRLDPGQAAYLMIDMALPDNVPQPSELIHVVKIATQATSYYPAESFQSVAQATVVSAPAVRIGPPLKGDGWIAAEVGFGRHHRTAVMPINGQWLAPERWAVDWVQVTPDNLMVTGDPSLNESYPQYGHDIIAVANGPVVSVRDGMPDQTAGKDPVGMTLDKAAGNYVLQDIGNGLCALYAHLKPGSVAVTAGQVLRQGDKLGLLGNSGNSTGPHLHFHVLRGRSPLGGDGVPYIIEQFRLQGTVSPDEDIEEAAKNSKPIHPLWFTEPETQRHRMPANVTIISF